MVIAVLFLFGDDAYVRVKAARLGIPPQLWRLVDAIVRTGVLQSPEAACDLFVPVEPIISPDAPLDADTDMVLR